MKKRFGMVNKHIALVPRDTWIEDWKREAILAFPAKDPLESYRRLRFMMLDADIVAASPTKVWRVLRTAGVIDRWKERASLKGTGFAQPLRPYEHWHVDFSYVYACGTFHSHFTVLDACSRAVVLRDIRESMTEQEVEVILQRARELYPEGNTRIIGDNGPQLIARDCKEFIQVSGMRHVHTSRYFPQANGKIERWHKTLKGDALRVTRPSCLDEARRVVTRFVAHDNARRLHSAIGSVTPREILTDQQAAIHAERDRRLTSARRLRAQRRRAARIAPPARVCARARVSTQGTNWRVAPQKATLTRWLPPAMPLGTKRFRTPSTTASARQWVPVSLFSDCLGPVRDGAVPRPVA